MSIEIELDFPGGKKVDARLGKWTIATDQGPDDGGDGSAPDPFQFFLSSLATCAGFYVLSYCQAHSIPTDELALTMRCELDEKRKNVVRVVFVLTVPTELPEKKRAALVRSLNMCTVKRHILNPPEFITEIVTAG